MHLIRRAAFQSSRSLTSAAAPTAPWFVDQEYERPLPSRQLPPHLKPAPPTVASVPEDAPEPVKLVHAALSRSPHLDPLTLVSSHAVAPPPGPPLPLKAPQGRRKRGSTYGGESMFDVPGGIWSWTVIAQVKEGTENRGAIESVVRSVRKMLATIDPPLPLVPKSKRRMANGWAMVDAGDFAVHVLSRAAREKYFGDKTW
ncbi:hypothetical protein P691DRAFT_663973 [Macrolepiota fuliginosa MF-IS2]|uniref:Uncharacterized protein n=1 Tax=Macrolepiota fuliginosa MF-IS2 TaxID=1400762 RepID=A0A9P6C3U7_9AGAR|nr:hypothetical protein P691DRAFT_663973 [Macrolepiota fuliginosa MF-IS2]